MEEPILISCFKIWCEALAMLVKHVMLCFCYWQHNNANYVISRYIPRGRMQTVKTLLLVPEGMNTPTAALVCKDVCKITTNIHKKEIGQHMYVL